MQEARALVHADGAITQQSLHQLRKILIVHDVQDLRPRFLFQPLGKEMTLLYLRHIVTMLRSWTLNSIIVPIIFRMSNVLTHAISHAVKEHPGSILALPAFHKGHVMTGLNADHSKQLKDFASNRDVIPAVVVRHVIGIHLERARRVVGSLRMTVALWNQISYRILLFIEYHCRLAFFKQLSQNAILSRESPKCW
jgi:hypothetical protein